MLYFAGHKGHTIRRRCFALGVHHIGNCINNLALFVGTTKFVLVKIKIRNNGEHKVKKLCLTLGQVNAPEKSTVAPTAHCYGG
jgi:hypothetical protein